VWRNSHACNIALARQGESSLNLITKNTKNTKNTKITKITKEGEKKSSCPAWLSVGSNGNHTHFEFGNRILPVSVFLRDLRDRRAFVVRIYVILISLGA
jgi:hypothetical protein